MCLSRLKNWAVVATILLLYGCSDGVDLIFVEANEYSVQIHESLWTVADYKITQYSKRYQQFIELVQTHKRGWSPTAAIYVPGVLVSGGGYHFNFIGEKIVVNYKDGQFYKNISKKEYAFLIQNNT